MLKMLGLKSGKNKRETHQINQQTRLQARLFRDKSICKGRQVREW